MPVPLVLVAPAAAAALAYLNARGALGYDAVLVKAALGASYRMIGDCRSGRMNRFYALEKLAKTKASANRPFLLFEGKSYTYAQAYDRILRYGAWWREKLGVREKDVVAIDFQNSDTFVFLWFGLWAVGAIPAFINTNLRGDVLVHTVKIAKTKLMVVDPEVQDVIDDKLRSDLPNVNIHVFSHQSEVEILAMVPKRYDDSIRVADKIEQMSMLIYTSGTTGLPKGAVVSWGKVIVGSAMSAAFVVNKPGEVMYTCMPLYHSAASILGLCNCLSAGSTIAIGKKFSTKSFWEEVRESNSTMIQYVGETCRYLLAAPPQVDSTTGENLDKKNKVHLALGNGLRPDIWNRFKDRFGIETIGELYTATEGTSALWNRSSNDFAVGAIGRHGWLAYLFFYRNAQVLQIDSDTEEPVRDPKSGLGKVARFDQPGELILKLPADNPGKRFQGYFGNEKATQSKLIRDAINKGDVWFRTGDVVRWDKQGRIYFHDRLGDTFRWKSENVSTQEVAHVVGLHPQVHEANVYGVELPHHDGRAGCVALALAGEADETTLQSLAKHVETGLPRYAQPLFLRVQEAAGANITGTNKQQKHVLRQQGVDLAKVDASDRMFWLKNGQYVEFEQTAWQQLCNGRVKL